MKHTKRIGGRKNGVFRSRPGIGLVECLILMVVAGVTFGAMFTTIAWGQRNYAFSIQDKESRELLFSWVQNFESVFPDVHDNVNAASTAVAGMMGGTYSNGTTRIGGFTITATQNSMNNGALVLEISIRTTGERKVWVNLFRSFNTFSNDSVPDVVES